MGDPAAFRALVEQYQAIVFNTALSLVQDHGMAEDICQEVFVTVFKSIRTFNERSALSTWIYRITVNKSLDQIRARDRRRKKGFAAPAIELSDQGAQHYPAVLDHPGIILEQREYARYLFAAIDTLPDNQKTAFVLAHIEELPQKDIADIMKISVKAVESLLQRAKQNLRAKLGDIYDRRKNKY